MKEKFFAGKKKYFTIPAIFLFALLFWPLFIGGIFVLLINKYIKHKKWKYGLIGLVILLSFSSLPDYYVNQNTTQIASETVLQTPPQPILSPTVTPMPTHTPIPTLTPIPTKKQTTQTTMVSAKVIKVVDGDTYSVSINGKKETIRVIGINTPETVDPRKPVECFGDRASKVAKDALTGETVQLEADLTQDDRDKYNRLLRYVWTDNGAVDFGKVLIATGFAYEYTYQTPYKYQATYKKAEQDARAGKKGLWADGACATPTGKPPQTKKVMPTQPVYPTATPLQQNIQSQQNNSSSGGDKDCGDFSTHSEAQAFFQANGPGDPHRLDRDNDGIACEDLP